jgi:hypothetical protein
LPYPYNVRTGTSFLGPASPATPADEYEMCPQCYNLSTPKRGIDGINSCPECGCKTDADGLEIVLCPICGKSVKIHSSEEAVECHQKWNDDKKEKDEEIKKARRSSALSTRQGRGSWDAEAVARSKGESIGWSVEDEIPEEASRWFRQGSLPMKHCPFCQKPVKEHTKEQSARCLSRLGNWEYPKKRP